MEGNACEVGAIGESGKGGEDVGENGGKGEVQRVKYFVW